MPGALVPVIGDRPPWVRVRTPEGWCWVWLSGHDRYYLTQLTRWRTKLKTFARFVVGVERRKAVSGYRLWLADELDWYQSIGQVPPGSKVDVPAVKVRTLSQLVRRECVRGHRYFAASAASCPTCRRKEAA
jgi:hypothetical protein